MAGGDVVAVVAAAVFVVAVLVERLAAEPDAGRPAAPGVAARLAGVVELLAAVFVEPLAVGAVEPGVVLPVVAFAAQPAGVAVPGVVLPVVVFAARLVGAVALPAVVVVPGVAELLVAGVAELPAARPVRGAVVRLVVERPAFVVQAVAYGVARVVAALDRRFAGAECFVADVPARAVVLAA